MLRFESLRTAHPFVYACHTCFNETSNETSDAMLLQDLRSDRGDGAGEPEMEPEAASALGDGSHRLPVGEQ